MLYSADEDKHRLTVFYDEVISAVKGDHGSALPAVEKRIVLFCAVIVQSVFLVFLESAAEGSEYDTFDQLHLHLLQVTASVIGNKLT